MRWSGTWQTDGQECRRVNKKTQTVFTGHKLTTFHIFQIRLVAHAHLKIAIAWRVFGLVDYARQTIRMAVCAMHND
jgi:hypothetical protein